MQRFKEKTEHGAVIHLQGAGGDDRTLCGYALEGEGRDTELTSVTRGKVNCEECANVVEWCRRVPARMLAPRDRRRNAL